MRTSGSAAASGGDARNPIDGAGSTSRVVGRLTGRALPIGSGAIAVAALLTIVAFAAGFQLGRPTSTPTPRPTSAPSSALPAASGLVIQPAIVAPALREAVIRSSSDGWAICTTVPSPTCTPLERRSGGPAQPGAYMFRFCQQGYCLSDVDPRALPWTRIDGSGLVLVAAASGAAAHAIVFDWEEPGRLPPSVSLEPAASDDRGFYFDLPAELGRGLHLVVVSELTPASLGGAGSYAEWTTYLAGIAIGVPVP